MHICCFFLLCSTICSRSCFLNSTVALQKFQCLSVFSRFIVLLLCPCSLGVSGLLSEVWNLLQFLYFHLLARFLHSSHLTAPQISTACSLTPSILRLFLLERSSASRSFLLYLIYFSLIVSFFPETFDFLL